MKVPFFPELIELEAIIEKLGDKAQVEIIDYIEYENHQFPIHCITLGSQQKNVPVIMYFGGVHGLEKIGTEILISYLQTIAELLEWDRGLADRLKHSRMVFVPIVNPVGVLRGSRCNPNGVDLMRNAPIDGIGRVKLYSGHRISPHLPWYRGNHTQMEQEALALCQVVQKQFEQSSLIIAVDLHSGFGIQDRLWFPYASTKKPFHSLPEIYALKELLDKCYPNHFYKFEPTSEEYVIHGDLWDYLYDDFLAKKTNDQALFIPLTLEMGSWLWLRKNPMHLFLRHGLFHPVLPHRQQRIMRRHLILFDFLYRATLYSQKWVNLPDEERQLFEQQALRFWYE
ncbi:MAG: hypothetical protein RLZZ66_2381 [Pseudomonadota bacterium]|jgi:hypothetical protein